MAIQTHTLAELGGGAVRLEYDYNDVTLRVASLRCINGSTEPAHGVLERQSDGLTIGGRSLTGARQTPVPTGDANRFQLTMDPIRPDRLAGIRAYLTWPYP